MTALLVVAGEASGDLAAAAVVEHLSSMRAFGLGGAACAAAGVDLVGDFRGWTALGVGEALARGPRALLAWRTLARAIDRRQPRAALLVNYSEFNLRLAPRLHGAGVRVLWYGAPQVWAWRRGRMLAVRRSVDRLAVMLPFEEPLWREAGVDAHFVGHPALEAPRRTRDDARSLLGMTRLTPAVAILPGSRPHEVRRLLEPMLDAYERVRSDRASLDARVLVAPSLDAETLRWVSLTCAARRVPSFDVDPRSGATSVLGAFDVALCASGTASLEAALVRAIPVVAYRVGVTTELAARLLLQTPFVALPNVLLGRRAFAELLQRDATASWIARALEDALDRRQALSRACDEVSERLGGAGASPSRAIARMLRPWLEVAPLDARAP